VLFHRTISRLTFESASLALYTHFEKCSRSLWMSPSLISSMIYPNHQLHYKVYGKIALVKTNTPALTTTNFRHIPHYILGCSNLCHINVLNRKHAATVHHPACRTSQFWWRTAPITDLYDIWQMNTNLLHGVHLQL